MFNWVRRWKSWWHGESGGEALPSHLLKLVESSARDLRLFALADLPRATRRRWPALLAGRLRHRARSLLARGRFAEADAVAGEIRHCYPWPVYLRQHAHYVAGHRAGLAAMQARLKKAARRAEVIRSLLEMLGAHKFGEAFALAQRETKLVSPAAYAELKAPFIQRYFETHYEHAINDEQLQALVCPARHVLVKARAGTGKTRVITARAALTLQEEGLHPDQILMLAFNQKAARELRDRMRKEFGIKGFVNASTFHSLAYRIARPQENIPGHEEQRYALVEQALQAAWSPELIEEAREFFRMDDEINAEEEIRLGDQEYYSYRRDRVRHVSLDGTFVKSRGEKWIADFLFEHDIAYVYEQHHEWSDGSSYRPDFTIVARPVDSEEPGRVLAIIEHWGVRRQEGDEDRFGAGGMTVGQYRQEMEEKRAYWQARDIPLLETSVDDLDCTRAAFEAMLRAQLEAHGIVCKPVPLEKLVQLVQRRIQTELGKVLQQFIQRAKNRRLSPADLEARLCAQTGPALDNPRRQHLWKLVTAVYAKYVEIMREAGLTDFQDMLEEAAAELARTRGRLSIPAKDSRMPFALDRLRWIFIDEYQDFAPGFNHLIETLLRVNPQVRLFCVGDDWQAINGFAGSDTHYFASFAARLQGARAVVLRRNHRSRRRIVEMGNRLMEELGTPAEWLPSHQGGELHCLAIDGKDRAGSAEEECYGLIEAALQKGNSVAVLSRTNYVYGGTLAEFEHGLKRRLSSAATPSRLLSVSTIHQYKGLQAHTVIVLDVTARSIPLIHPDTELYAPLLAGGATNVFEEAFLDERRLFYVALTRATHTVYLLTEAGKESMFLWGLGLAGPGGKSAKGESAQASRRAPKQIERQVSRAEEAMLPF